MIDLSNKTPVNVPMVPCYQHDGDYDRCACGRSKLRSDRLCGACQDGM